MTREEALELLGRLEELGEGVTFEGSAGWSGGGGTVARGVWGVLLGAVVGVVEVHVPGVERLHMSGGVLRECVGCGPEWPCMTWQVVAGRLVMLAGLFPGFDGGGVR